LNSRLDEMSKEEIAQVLSYVENLHYVMIMESDELAPDYDPDKDPTIGFFAGPPDLASRAKQILRGRDLRPEDDL
jgi:hypothetical protein